MSPPDPTPLQAAPFALLTLDGLALDRDELRVIDANPRAAALFGTDDGAALLGPMERLFAATPGAVGRITAARLAGRADHVEDITVRRFDGGVLDVLLQVTFPPRGAPTNSILVLMIDVTDRLRGDVLLSSIAHEVQQPLSAIAANAGAALRWLDRDTPPLEKVRPLLARIGANAHRAGDLLRNLRTSRDGGPAHDALDVNAVVAETCDLVRHDAGDRRIGLDLALAGASPLVRGDRIQLQQVVFNLLMNAVQAIDRSTVRRRRVSVSTAIGGDGVRLSVTDTGPGVPPSDLDRIFARAFTTKPDGMGLGLALCRSIVEAHRGSIHASNAPGGGARFEVVLPVASGG
jgi:signal transduction histidine kinase